MAGRRRGALLFGAEPTDEVFSAATEAELADAKPLPGNEFKIEPHQANRGRRPAALRDEAVAA